MTVCDRFIDAIERVLRDQLLDGQLTGGMQCNQLREKSLRITVPLDDAPYAVSVSDCLDQRHRELCGKVTGHAHQA